MIYNSMVSSIGEEPAALMRGIKLANEGETYAADYPLGDPDLWFWLRRLSRWSRMGLLRWRRAQPDSDNRADSAFAARYLIAANWDGSACGRAREHGPRAYSIGTSSMRYTSTVQGVVSFASSWSAELCTGSIDCKRQHEFPGTRESSATNPTTQAGDEQRDCGRRAGCAAI